MIKAFLFDFDGVVADSPHLNFRSWQQAFSEQALAISELEYFRMEGMGPRGIAKHFCLQNGIDPLRDEEFVVRKEAFMVSLGNPSIYEGIYSLLKSLNSQGIKLALVTGASKQRITRSLPETLALLFDAIVTSDDVTHTKPHPEPYLNAADALGITPEEAVVIENAPLGIEAAKKGGFFCIAITTTLPVSELQSADEVVLNHATLAEAVFRQARSA